LRFIEHSTNRMTFY